MSGRMILRSGAVVAPKLFTAARYRKATRFMNRAYPMVKYLHQNRRAAGMKIARSLGRYAKSRMARRALPLGDRRGKDTCKRSLQRNTGTASNTSLSTRTLYTEALNDISGTANNAINARQRDVAYVTGTKICMAVNSLSPLPLHFNWAVVSRKDQADAAPTVTDFFRSMAGTRSQNFATGLSSLQFSCLPINKDKYHILTHHRRLLASTGEATVNDGVRKSYIEVQKWIPIKRQFRFDGDAATTAERRYFLVYWFDTWMAQAASAPIADQVAVYEHHTTYFREPK